MESLPIKCHEHLQLANVGIRVPNITFSNVTMESDKNIVVREMIGDQQQVVIIDLADTANPTRLPIHADSVIMHLTAKILAFKFGKTLQIYDLELKAKVKAHQNVEDVVYWKWISDKNIALVSDTAVYHWSIEGDAAPVKMFDRHQSLAGTQIINYRADAENKWLVLIGISAKDSRVVGSMQLYSTERKVSQPIEGHAASFVRFKVNGNHNPSNLLCFSVKTDQGGKLHIIEVGTPVAGNTPFQEKKVDIPYTADTAGDFPVSMQVSTKQGIIYLVTKQGYVHLYDVESGTRIYSNRISTDTVFVTCEYTATGGIMGINTKGQVLSVSIDEAKLVPFVTNQLRNPDLALKLAVRCDLPDSEELISRKLDFSMESMHLKEAKNVAVAAPLPEVNLPRVWSQFLDAAEKGTTQGSCRRLRTSYCNAAAKLSDTLEKYGYNLGENYELWNKFFPKVCAYLEANNEMIQRIVREHFLGLHVGDLEDFSIRFEDKADGTSIGTICQVKYSGCDKRFFIKCHQRGPRSSSFSTQFTSTSPPYIQEIYIYKLLSLLKIGGEVHFLLPITSNHKKALYIATAEMELKLAKELTAKNANPSAMLIVHFLQVLFRLEDIGTNGGNFGQSDKGEAVIIDFWVTPKDDYTLSDQQVAEFWENTGNCNSRIILKVLESLTRDQRKLIIQQAIKGWDFQNRLDEARVSVEQFVSRNGEKLAVSGDLCKYIRDIQYNFQQMLK
uniref:Clathrin-link domain-containing protein n=1 Tax=Caenorhabditis tropicalis TaxID=1561998 RepID=A0A1I7TNL3_9PELO